MTRRIPRNAARLLILTVVTLAAAGSVLARSYMTPGFRAKTTRPVTVAILPPHAELIKSKVVMTDQMLGEAAALEREAALALKTELETRGYRVRLVTPEEMTRNARLRQLVVRVNDRWAEEWSKIVRRPRTVRQSRFNGGEDSVRLCSLLKVNGLALTRIIGFGNTKGKAFLSGMANMGTPAVRSYARLDLGIVNGRQGQVEAFFIGIESSSLGQLTKKPAKIMGEVARKTVTRYPGADEVEIVDDEESEKAVAASNPKKGKNAESDDDAAIQDFEMLLKKGGAPASKP